MEYKQGRQISYSTHGQAYSTNGDAYSVHGDATSVNGDAYSLHGYAKSGSGNAYSIHGWAHSDTGNCYTGGKAHQAFDEIEAYIERRNPDGTPRWNGDKK